MSFIRELTEINKTPVTITKSNTGSILTAHCTDFHTLRFQADYNCRTPSLRSPKAQLRVVRQRRTQEAKSTPAKMPPNILAQPNTIPLSAPEPLFLIR
jgi:hypothetical protein